MSTSINRTVFLEALLRMHRRLHVDKNIIFTQFLPRLQNMRPLGAFDF